MRRALTISLGIWGRLLVPTALMAAWVAVIVNWRSPAVRLSVGWMNPLAFLLAMTLPSLCLVLVWIVRQERTIVPGVLRVAELASVYRASDARVELLGPRRIRLTVAGRRPREIALPLG